MMIFISIIEQEPAIRINYSAGSVETGGTESSIRGWDSTTPCPRKEGDYLNAYGLRSAIMSMPCDGK